MSYNNGELLRADDSTIPSTHHDETTPLMLASDLPKKRTGRIKFKETRHPVYRGVRQRSSGKWVSEVRHPNKKDRLWLGTFLTADMAARAHDVASIALRGTQGACLNFADSLWRLPVPASSDTKDIQKAAAQAAEAFRPPPEDRVEYIDEDMVFGMPGLLSEMYQGLGMFPPPHPGCSSSSHGYDHDPDHDSETADVSLWNFSF